MLFMLSFELGLVNDLKYTWEALLPSMSNLKPVTGPQMNGKRFLINILDKKWILQYRLLITFHSTKNEFYNSMMASHYMFTCYFSKCQLQMQAMICCTNIWYLHQFTPKMNPVLVHILWILVEGRLHICFIYILYNLWILAMRNGKALPSKKIGNYLKKERG